MKDRKVICDIMGGLLYVYTCKRTLRNYGVQPLR